ncbi:MAG: hypothetical protein ACOX87_07880 [Chloroflexota bacterium]|jgi:hypothetical protein
MVALVSTMHDPEGRMVEATKLLIDRLLEMYEAVVVAPTSHTSPDILDALRGATVELLEESNGRIGVGRRHALRMGLRTTASHLQYCDFDRILHWIGRYPEELASTLEELQKYDYTIIGRTDRAFASHPRVQRDTEAITNHAFSLWFGQPVDISAGSCGVSRRAAALLLEKSVAPSNATDAEWPALVQTTGKMTVGFTRTEGLEFETPDYFADEIAQAGSLEAWLEERSRPLTAWIARTRLTLESLESILAVSA